jgi:transcription factor C subunit 7
LNKTNQFPQYRSNWNVDPSTGHYNSNIPSPTGIVADPALASYGVAQSQQLGKHLLNLSPPVDKIYSSPFYRCIQTLQPFTTAREAKSPGSGAIHVEPGVGEFYGLARFDHPSPAPIEELRRHFEHLEKDKTPIIVPSTKVSCIPSSIHIDHG